MADTYLPKPRERCKARYLKDPDGGSADWEKGMYVGYEPQWKRYIFLNDDNEIVSRPDWAIEFDKLKPSGPPAPPPPRKVCYY